MEVNDVILTPLPVGFHCSAHVLNGCFPLMSFVPFSTLVCIGFSYLMSFVLWPSLPSLPILPSLLSLQTLGQQTQSLLTGAAEYYRARGRTPAP